MGWGILILWGIIAIITGFILISMGFMREYGMQLAQAPGEEKPTIKGGGVIMIGPIPIALGSDSRYLVIALALAIVLMLLALAFVLL